MKVSLLAVIFGLLIVPVFAQTPEPVEIDTTQQAVEPDVTEEAAEPEQAVEPEAVEEAGEAEETMEAAPPAFVVQDMTFCTGVVDREPATRDTSFISDVGQLFFWSNVLNDGGEGSIEHVWYYNGEEMARVELPAKYARNRVWSSKKILPEWTGEWKVTIMAGSEKLGELTCTID